MKYLESSYFFDYENPIIQELISDYKSEAISDQEKATAMYLKVRDGWRYDPYNIDLSKESYVASFIAKKTSGNCVEKSILLISCLRALQIPSRLHLGKVKNHLAIERLMEKFGSSELTPHGMVELYLNKTWLKVSPAFNASLCKKFHVDPLPFDGENSSFLQKYNDDGKLFMEYTDDYGHFNDVPLEFMKENLKQHYPHIFNTGDAITFFKL